MRGEGDLRRPPALKGSNSGGMAEWSMAAVLKTVDRKVRGFESCSLRQHYNLATGGQKAHARPISGADLPGGKTRRGPAATLSRATDRAGCAPYRQAPYRGEMAEWPKA